MNSKKYLATSLVQGLFLFILYLLVVPKLQAFNLYPLPEKMTGGEGFLVRFEGDPKGDYRVHFENKDYRPFLASKDVWEILLPLGIKTAGKRELVVEKISPSGQTEKHFFTVNVAQKKLRTVTLGKTSRKIRRAQPSVPKQQKKVLAALKHRELKKYWNQPFSLPLEVEVDTEFGLKRRLGNKTSYHWGVDLSAPEGTPVQAANSGKVVLSEHNFNIYGNLLVIDHGQGVISCYFHLSRIFKKAGEMVGQNEVIAEVGNTGWSTGPHLHFGIYLQGKPVDPLWLIHFTSQLAPVENEL